MVRVQLERIKAALRQVLRAGSGRDVSATELRNRASAYTDPSIPRVPLLVTETNRIPNCYPLTHSFDYSPQSQDDPLGGMDGRGISRSWSSIREDLDCSNSTLTEAERKLYSVIKLLRGQASSLGQELENIQSQSLALEAQVTSMYYGNTLGESYQVVNNTVDQNIYYPLTTGIINDHIGMIPTLSGSVVSGTITSCTDPNVATGTPTAAFIETPTPTSIAWSWQIAASGTNSVTVSLSDSVSAIEITLAPGMSASIDSSFSTISYGGSFWVIPTSPITGSVTITFSGITNSNVEYGSVSKIKFHQFSFNTIGQFVWGPFESAQVSSLSITPNQSLPNGSSASWSFSTEGPNGSWIGVTPGNTYTLSTSDLTNAILTNAQPDSVTYGYYNYPVAGVGSTQGASFSAGIGQVLVSAYPYSWSVEGDPLHTPTPNDWISPQGIVRTVVMNGSMPYSVSTASGTTVTTYTSKALSDYIGAGSVIGEYTDDLNNTASGGGLMSIAITSSDGSYVLQQGVNYKFSFSVWVSSVANLNDIPVGLFNPNVTTAGSTNSPAFSVLLNGAQVYQGNTYFTNYAELSPAPSNYGSSISNYYGVGQSSVGLPVGATWPPYAGRMNLIFKPGWNEIDVLIYIPDTTGQADFTDSLGVQAAIILGPNLFQDATSLQDNIGVSIMRAFPQPWTQVDEYTLRHNWPQAQEQVWSWITDIQTGEPTGILLNHNPSASELGFISLDNVLTGDAVVHEISYLSNTDYQFVSSLGSNSVITSIWVKAVMNSTNTSASPYLENFLLEIN